MKILAILLTTLVLTAGCAAETDQSRVQLVLNSVSGYAKAADEELNASYRIIQSVGGGRATYEAADLIKPHREQVAILASLIADDHERLAGKIENEQLRTTTRRAVELTWEVYNSRLESLKRMEKALLVGDIGKITTLAKQHTQSENEYTVKMFSAMSHFSEAKKLAGLPADLSEFK